MIRRSRGGCKECRRSRVKCDEERPTCGTCKRRSRECPGYRQSENITTDVGEARRLEPLVAASPQAASSNNGLCLYRHRTETRRCDDNNATSRSPSMEAVMVAAAAVNASAAHVVFHQDIQIPKGLFPSADESAMHVYFDRHIRQISMGDEFAPEDNKKVSQILHRNPELVGDVLIAIGQTYLSRETNTSLVPALDRRAKVLTQLRTTADPAQHLESFLLMILGLCALELIDVKGRKDPSCTSFLVVFAASLVRNSIARDIGISSLSKFLIRSLARQDMIISLTKRQRPLIDTAVWLDEECRHSADRFMGYTMTIMPMLEELCILAEELKLQNQGVNITPCEQGVCDPPLVSSGCIYRNNYRTNDLRSRIDSWRPHLPEQSSLRSSKRYFRQAYAYRSAALLYLHRLLYPAQSSPEVDAVALNMAYDVMVHLEGTGEELRMFLWPTFIAGCELRTKDDRAAVLDVLDKIYNGRKSTTALRTKMILTDHVWQAMDVGANWNWMALVDEYPEDFAPL